MHHYLVTWQDLSRNVGHIRTDNVQLDEAVELSNHSVFQAWIADKYNPSVVGVKPKILFVSENDFMYTAQDTNFFFGVDDVVICLVGTEIYQGTIKSTQGGSNTGKKQEVEIDCGEDGVRYFPVSTIIRVMRPREISIMKGFASAELSRR